MCRTATFYPKPAGGDGQADFSRQAGRERTMTDGTTNPGEPEAGAMNLETILIMTGEMDHLAALLRHMAQDMEGVRAADMVQDMIHPLLDELEAELRETAPEKPDRETLRKIIAAWIDRKMDGPAGA